MKRIITLLLLILFAGSLLSGCGSSSKEKTEVHIGYFDNITHAQALLMKSEGSLEEALKDQAEVTWTAFNAGPAEVEALFAGDIDIGYIGPVPAITANVKSNGDVQILSGATKAGAVLVKRSGSDIQSIEDLAGKTVTVPQIGNTQHLNLLYLLSQHGLKPTTEGGDVTVTAIANADVANVMERGDVDASIVPEPWGSKLIEQGAELVLDYDQIYTSDDYDVAVLVVRKEFQEKHPEIVKEFLSQHENMTALIADKKEDSLKKINDMLLSDTGKNLPDEILASAFDRIKIGTELNKDSIKLFGQISKEQGFIKEEPGDELYFKE